MFESNVVDVFSRIPAWIVPAIYVPIVGCLLVYGAVACVSAGWLLAQFALGWFVWTLMEYWLHRTVFHWVPDTSWGEQFHFYMHGVHHQWFTDKYRLVMPPVASLGTAVVVYGALHAIGWMTSSLVTPTWTYGFFAGIAFGYTVYDCTHYYIHHFKPKGPIGLALRAHHNKHHHNPAFAEKKFGVSTTLWDHVFRTYE